MNPTNLKTGDVLHCRGKRLLSRLIMWTTKSKWSHTAIFIEIWGQPFILEAQREGVRPINYYEWLKKYGYYFEVSRNEYLMVNDHDWSLHAMSKSGVAGYDFVSLLIRQPIHLLTGKWKKQKVEDDRMYCSEYAMWCHYVTKSYRMTPQHVYEYTHNTKGWNDVKL